MASVDAFEPGSVFDQAHLE